MQDWTDDLTASVRDAKQAMTTWWMDVVTDIGLVKEAAAINIFKCDDIDDSKTGLKRKNPAQWSRVMIHIQKRVALHFIDEGL